MADGRRTLVITKGDSVTSKCTDHLVQEHQVILRACAVLAELAKLAVKKGQVDEQDASGTLEILRVFGDEHHQGKEEGALFPTFTSKCSSDEIEPIRRMLYEHDQDRSLIEGIDEALLRSDAADFADYANRLVEVLRTHIQKEDHVLFPLIESHLSSEDDAQMLREFAAFDADFEKRGHSRLLHRLRMLEWKYLSQAA